MTKPSRKATAAERQIKLALYVRAAGPVSRAQIQEHLAEYAPAPKKDLAARKRSEASARRRFERDKAALAEQGIRIGSTHDDLYSVLPADNGAFAHIEQGSTQAALLRVSSAALLQDPAFEHAGNLRMALAKLSTMLEVPDTLFWAKQEALQALRPVQDSSEGTLRKARSALKARKLLSFEYADTAGKTTQREVEPIGLYAANGHEYLAAWDRLRTGERAFRLDRMSHVKVNESGRGNPDFEARAFDPARWQLLPFQMGSAAADAVVRISPCAQWQAINLCSAHGSVVKEPIGTSSWHVTCADTTALAMWCIANGPGLVPASPQEAVDVYWRLIDEASRWGGGEESTAGRKAQAEEEAATGKDALGAVQVAGCAQQPDHATGANSNDAEQDAAESLASSADNASDEPFALELAFFADTLAASYASKETPAPLGRQALTDDELLFAMLSLVEQAGAVSIPQAARLLDISEAKAYRLLESLAFCYDAAAGTCLELGEPGCSFAVLKHPVGIEQSLTHAEASSLANAAIAFTSGGIISTVTAACAQDNAASLLIGYWKEGDQLPRLRVVDPQAMVVRDGHTYLQAWCRKAQDERLFRLDRIISASILHAEDAASASQALAAAASASTQAAGETQSAATKTAKAIVSLAAGVPTPSWPKLSKAKKPAVDGTTTLCLPWLGTPWLPKQLASYGAAITRIEPTVLARATGNYARSLREQPQADA